MNNKKYKVKYRRVGRNMDIYEITSTGRPENEIRARLELQGGFNIVSIKEIKK